MASEAALQRAIKKAILTRWSGASWVIKTHGSQYQAGVPDLLVVVKSAFIAFEVKLPGREHTLTRLQAAEIQNIRNAGAHAFVVVTVDDAIKKVEEVTDGAKEDAG